MVSQTEYFVEHPCAFKARRVGALGGVAVAFLSTLPAVSSGQDIASGAETPRIVSVVPRVSLSQSFTDNARLSADAKQPEQITEISPGIRISKDRGHIKGHFDYALSGLNYAQGTSARRTQNALDTLAQLELVDGRAYVDLSGTVSQQAISALGVQSTDSTSVNPNKTEVSSFRFSPYWTGEIGDIANVQARYSRSLLDADSRTASDVSVTELALNLQGRSAVRNLGWITDITSQDMNYSAGRPTEARRFDLGLSYMVTPQLDLKANVGREFNSYTSLDVQSYGTSSMGLSWSPSERSRFSVVAGHRSFGESHSVTFDHKTALTEWRFSDTRDVSATPSQRYLVLGDAEPGALLISSFLSSAVSLQRRQDVSVALTGARDTVTLAVTASENSRLDTLSVAADDLNGVVLRQWGMSVNFLHRLTPDYSLGLLVSRQVTSGAVLLEDAVLRLLNLSINGRVGRNLLVALGIRNAAYRGATSYDENSITLNLTAQF